METPSLLMPYVGRGHHVVIFDIDGDDLSATEPVDESSLSFSNRLFSRSSFPHTIRHAEHRSYKQIARPIANKDLILSRTHVIEFSSELKREAILSMCVSFCKRGAAHLKRLGHATPENRGGGVYLCKQNIFKTTFPKQNN